MSLNRFYLLCVSATLLATNLISCCNLAEVSADAYYVEIDNLYDEGQFDAYSGATAIPTGWESVYDFDMISNYDFSINDSTMWSLPDIYEDLTNQTYKVNHYDATQSYTLTNHYAFDNSTAGTSYFWSFDYKTDADDYARIRMRDNIYANMIFYSLIRDNNWHTHFDIITSLHDWTSPYIQLVNANTTIPIHQASIFEFDNIRLFNLSKSFHISIPTSTKFSNGLANSLTHFRAGLWDIGSPPQTGIYFSDTSWERYNYSMPSVDEGDIIYIQYDMQTNGDSDRACFNSSCEWAYSTLNTYSTIEVADADFQLSISNFDGYGYDPTRLFFDNIMVFNLTDIFLSGNEPTAEEFENDYLSKLPDWFETYNFLLAEVLVANEGDLVVGTIPKEDFLTDYSYMYLAYKQPYTIIDILATEDDIIDDCVAEFLFQNDWFDLDANVDTCELNFNNPNYDTLLNLLQDGVVQSDLTNDSYFSINYTNADYIDRTTQVLISFDEIVQGVRTVVISFADSSSQNDFNQVAFQFKYNDFIVGYQEDAITYLWQENAIVLTIYNTLLKYNSLDIFIKQTSASPDTKLGLTELAFLKDTLVSIPTGTRNIDAESDFLLDFQFEYANCGTWDFGCKIKNSMIWLTVESPPAVSMWERYGEMTNQIYDITRIQNDFIDVLDQTGIQAGIGAIVTLLTALTSIMLYSLFMKFFK